MKSFEDTIVAISSGGLPAAIAVVRASGPKAIELIRHVAGSLPAPRQAAYLALREGPGGDLIDRGLVLRFEGPGSATGEDVAEFHVHGSRAVAAALLRALTAIDGVRLAEPGEFSRRAFLNGRMDLTEAEGLADLIAAETEAERRQAVQQAGGALRHAAEDWRRRLIVARAAIEAELDFSDEEDVDGAALAGTLAAVADIRREVEDALARSRNAPRLADGFQVAIVGPPNVGKSSLINALAEREVAIVTEHAGTTRDVVEARLDLGGYPVVLLDTAGLREAADPVERIGIERALARARAADLVLQLAALDDDADPRPALERYAMAAQRGPERRHGEDAPFDPEGRLVAHASRAPDGHHGPEQPQLPEQRHLSEERKLPESRTLPATPRGPATQRDPAAYSAPTASEAAHSARTRQVADTGPPPETGPVPDVADVANRPLGELIAGGVERLRVWTKADAAPPDVRRARHGDGFVVSAVTGEGLQALTAELAARAGATFSTAATSLVTRERHVSELSALRDALAAISADAPLEIVAEQLRQASQPLGRLTGAIDVEDVLDALFGEFCIGK